MMKTPIYLDNAASTPLDERVLAAMLPYLSQQQGFGNPSTTHYYGRAALRAIDSAREQVAELITAKPYEIIWTSGATEANNLAIKGIAYAYKSLGKHIITASTEHSSVLASCEQLAKEGFTITYLTPQKNGLLDLAAIKAAIKKDTILISIMQVNNETGVIQDIAKISEIAREHKLFFHVDAVQSVGKIAINLSQLMIDLMSFSAHKLYGPKGVGALYINHARAIKLQPLSHGGGQENNLRAGTLPTHQIIGMGAAFALAQKLFIEDNARIKRLSEQLWNGIKELYDVQLNGDFHQRVPHILNIAFANIAAKQLLPALKDLAVASGSACHEAKAMNSHVLQSMAIPANLINNSVRFSLGRFNTTAEIDFAVAKIIQVVKTLRACS